jgi:hypothetical protein
VSTPSTSTANSTSSDAPSSTISGTPAVSRNAVAAMPLSSMRKPTACDTARRRLTMTNTPISTTANPAGAARVAVLGSAAISGRVTARAITVRPAAASREAAVLTSGLLSRRS